MCKNNAPPVAKPKGPFTPKGKENPFKFESALTGTRFVATVVMDSKYRDQFLHGVESVNGAISIIDLQELA